MPDRPKVTLEDLLRLKRAERPSPEFWTTFEQELRQKQLAALVKGQPWWHGLPRRLFVPAAYLPVGATAILALTFVSLKYYTPAPTARMETPTRAAVADDTARDTSSPGVAITAAAVPAPAADQAEPAPVRFDDRVSVTPAEPAVQRTVEEVTARLPWIARGGQAVSDSPSARSIAANLQQLEQTEPELVLHALLSGVRPAAAPRVQTASAHAIDLSNIASNVSHRTRVLAASLTQRQYTSEPTAPELVRERNARRLAEADLSDQISRLGLKGDRVSLKF